MPEVSDSSFGPKCCAVCCHCIIFWELHFVALLCTAFFGKFILHFLPSPGFPGCFPFSKKPPWSSAPNSCKSLSYTQVRFQQHNRPLSATLAGQVCGCSTPREVGLLLSL